MSTETTEHVSRPDSKLLFGLEPGTYRLDKPVRNPKPDRRVKRDWREMPSFPAGIYQVRERVSSMTVDGITYTGVSLEVHRAAGYRSQTISNPGINSEPDDRETLRWNALAPKLVPAERTLTSYMLNADIPKHALQDILEDLIETKTISFEDLGDAWENVQAKWDKEDETS